jgi:hypothetical protein
VLVSEWDTKDAIGAYHRSAQFPSYQFNLHGLLARLSETRLCSVTDAMRPVQSAAPDPRDAD